MRQFGWKLDDDVYAPIHLNKLGSHNLTSTSKSSYHYGNRDFVPLSETRVCSSASRMLS